MRVGKMGALIALVVAVGLSGCQHPVAEVRAAPSFDLPDLAGGTVSLAALKGKVVVLDFWATWCGPCLKELPDYAEFWRKNQGKGVEVIGVVFESGEPQEIQDFVRENRIPYRQLLGDDKLQEAFRANQGFPTTFVIDGEGIIRTTILGSTPRKFEKLQQTVDAALAAR
jgi:cytochrome c biogenesis protein CcmG/thiol:disulfide interchange protein DsbE